MSTNYAAMLMFLLGALVVCTSADCEIPSKPVKLDETSYNGKWYEHGNPPNNPVGCRCKIYSFLDDHILIEESCASARNPVSYVLVTDPNDNGTYVTKIYVLEVVYDKYTIEYRCINGHSFVEISTRDKDYEVPQADIDKVLTENGITELVTITYSTCK